MHASGRIRLPSRRVLIAGWLATVCLLPFSAEALERDSLSKPPSIELNLDVLNSLRASSVAQGRETSLVWQKGLDGQIAEYDRALEKAKPLAVPKPKKLPKPEAVEKPAVVASPKPVIPSAKMEKPKPVPIAETPSATLEKPVVPVPVPTPQLPKAAIEPKATPAAPQSEFERLMEKPATPSLPPVKAKPDGSVSLKPVPVPNAPKMPAEISSLPKSQALPSLPTVPPTVPAVNVTEPALPPVSAPDIAPLSLPELPPSTPTPPASLPAALPAEAAKMESKKPETKVEKPETKIEKPVPVALPPEASKAETQKPETKIESAKPKAEIAEPKVEKVKSQPEKAVFNVPSLPETPVATLPPLPSEPVKAAIEKPSTPVLPPEEANAMPLEIPPVPDATLVTPLPSPEAPPEMETKKSGLFPNLKKKISGMFGKEEATDGELIEEGKNADALPAAPALVPAAETPIAETPAVSLPPAELPATPMPEASNGLPALPDLSTPAPNAISSVKTPADLPSLDAISGTPTPKANGNASPLAFLDKPDGVTTENLPVAQTKGFENAKSAPPMPTNVAIPDSVMKGMNLPPLPVAATKPAAPVEAKVASLPDTQAVTTSGASRVIRFAKDEETLPETAKPTIQQIAKDAASDKQKRVKIVAFAGGNSAQPSMPRRLALKRAYDIRTLMIKEGVDMMSINVAVQGADAGSKNDNTVEVSVAN